MPRYYLLLALLLSISLKAATNTDTEIRFPCGDAFAQRLPLDLMRLTHPRSVQSIVREEPSWKTDIETDGARLLVARASAGGEVFFILLDAETDNASGEVVLDYKPVRRCRFLRYGVDEIFDPLAYDRTQVRYELSDGRQLCVVGGPDHTDRSVYWCPDEALAQLSAWLRERAARGGDLTVADFVARRPRSVSRLLRDSAYWKAEVLATSQVYLANVLGSSGRQVFILLSREALAGTGAIPRSQVWAFSTSSDVEWNPYLSDRRLYRYQLSDGRVLRVDGGPDAADRNLEWE